VVLLVFYLINHPQLPFEDASGLPINQITNQPVSFELQLKSLTNIQNKIFWLSRDGYGILVPVSVFVGSQISASSVDNVLRKKIEILSTDTIKLFKENGYSIDIRNTSQSSDDFKYGLLVTALTSADGSVFCKIQKSDIIPIWSLNCIARSDFDEAYNQQLPFLLALDIPKFSGIAVSVTQSDDYARVDISNGEVGAGYSILKKIDDQWTKLYGGQDDPPCKIMQENNVPGQIYGNKCVPGTVN
jgi:hypothetical protein